MASFRSCALTILVGVAVALPAAAQVLPEPLARRESVHRAERARAVSAQLDAAYEFFLPLAEWLLTLRAESVDFAGNLTTGTPPSRPITGRDLERLRIGTVEHLAARSSTLELIAPYRRWHLDGPETEFLEPQIRHRGVLLATAGAALLYDNFELAVRLFAEDGRLRGILNRSDRGFGLEADQLLGAMRLYYSPEERAEFRAALGWLRDRDSSIEGVSDERARWLSALLAESPSARRFAGGSPLTDVTSLLGELPDQWNDLLRGLVRETTQQTVASLMGSSAGAPTPRLGSLDPTPDLITALADDLEPLDVLLDKSRWRGAIDVAIPGYFTHVAVWLGDRADLEAAGVWRHPLVVPHHSEFEHGPVVIEAVRSGVKLTPLPEFLNLDELVVVRRRAHEPAGVRESLVRAFRQLGKDYDFNFEIETTDRLVCSELPYLVFTDVDWRTESFAGRAVISPDNVARAALDGGPFRIVRMLVGNRPVESDPEAALRSRIESEAERLR